MPLVLSGDGAVGPLSATEVSYLDGVTSAVQTQINGKLATPGAWSSWTPVVFGATTRGTGTYTTQVGRYTEIGKTVHLFCQVTWTAHTGTGQLRIDGYPVGGAPRLYPATLILDNIASPASSIVTAGIDGLLIQFYSYPVAGGSFASLAMDTAGTIYLSATYEAA